MPRARVPDSERKLRLEHGVAFLSHGGGAVLPSSSARAELC
jgi:hypothetical protein